MHITKLGYFEKDNYTSVPYQHHSSKWIWKVLVTKREKKGENEKISQQHALVFATTAREASNLAIIEFERIMAFQRSLKDADLERKKPKINKISQEEEIDE
jgi:hypothetical protein